jgi:hypothetical protein
LEYTTVLEAKYAQFRTEYSWLEYTIVLEAKYVCMHAISDGNKPGLIGDSEALMYITGPGSWTNTYSCQHPSRVRSSASRPSSS